MNPYCALSAGEENPRCLVCDEFLAVWSKGEPLICELCSNEEPLPLDDEEAPLH